MNHEQTEKSGAQARCPSAIPHVPIISIGQFSGSEKIQWIDLPEATPGRSKEVGLPAIAVFFAEKYRGLSGVISTRLPPCRSGGRAATGTRSVQFLILAATEQ